MVSLRASLVAVAILTLATTAVGCAQETDTIAATNPATEDEVRASDGRLEIYEEPSGWAAAITDASGTRLLVMSERFADRAAAETASASLLGYASVGYAFYARPVDGQWAVELLHAGKTIAATAPHTEESAARRDVSKARALMRAIPFPASADAAYGQLRFALAKRDSAYSFVLRGRDGASLLHSESYASLASALHGIDNVFLYADSGDPRFAVNEESDGHRLSLVAYNGQTIGAGELYPTPAEAQAAAAEITSLVEGGIPTVAE